MKATGSHDRPSPPGSMSALRVAIARSLVAVMAGSFVATIAGGPPVAAQTARSGDCVTIGKPRPSISFTYERQEANGRASEYTHYWEELTATGSRLRTVRGPSVLIQVTEHSIEDDVSVVRATSTSGTGTGNTRTTFSPGVVGDPTFRACAGRSWHIPAVTARHSSGHGEHAASTYPGTLAIVAIRESVTVPAGTFQTVHYTRSGATPVGMSVEEYWKSIEHGVIVKHTSTLPGGASTAVLVSIR